jgi:hypothetical protein
MSRILVKAPRKTKAQKKAEEKKKRDEAMAAISGPRKEKPAEEKPAEEKPDSDMDKLTEAIQNLPEEQRAKLAESLGLSPEPADPAPRFRGGATEFDTRRNQRRRSALPGTTTIKPGAGIRIREEREREVDPETGKVTFEPTGKTKVTQRGKRINILSEQDKMRRERKQRRDEAGAASKRSREMMRDTLREDEDKTYTFDNPPIGHVGGDFEYSKDWPIHTKLFAQKMRNSEGKMEMSNEFQRHNSLSRILNTFATNYPEESEKWLKIPGLADKAREITSMGKKERARYMPFLIDAMTKAIKAEPEILQEQGLRLANSDHLRQFAGGGAYGPQINLGYIDRMAEGSKMTDEEKGQMESDKRRNRLLSMASEMNVPESKNDMFTQLVDGLLQEIPDMSEEAAAKMIGERLVSMGEDPSESSAGSVYDDPKVFGEQPASARPATVGTVPGSDREGKATDRASAATKERSGDIAAVRQSRAMDRAASIRARTGGTTPSTPPPADTGGMTLGDFLKPGPHAVEGASEGPPVPSKPALEEEDDRIENSEIGYQSLGEMLLKSIVEDMWQRT